MTYLIIPLPDGQGVSGRKPIPVYFKICRPTRQQISVVGILRARDIASIHTMPGRGVSSELRRRQRIVIWLDTNKNRPLTIKAFSRVL